MSVSLDSTSKEEKVAPVIINRVSPRTIPGILSAANKGALDWGWQSFVAYGCHNHVVVIDTQNIKVFQTLVKHTSDIVKVKWASENYYHDLSHPYTLQLASLDISGLIVVWDVKEGKALNSFFEVGKPTTDIEWMSGRDSCRHLLVGLHPPYSLVLWNTETGNKVWKKSYTETILSFAFDPFAANNITFLASDCILFVDDFTVHKSPSSNGRKFYISNPSSSTAPHNSPSEEKGKGRSTITRRMWLLAKSDSKPSEPGVTLNECLNLTYHKSYRHHLLLLYPKEVLILDLEINQTVGIVGCEFSGSPLLQVHSCWQRDALLTLHESGSTSFRLRHRGRALMAAATPINDCSDTGVHSSYANLEVTYDVQCQSESLRLTKHAKVMGMAVCPVTEGRVAILISDGRIVFLEMAAMHQDEFADCFPPYLSANLYDRLSAKLGDAGANPDLPLQPLESDALHPANALCDNIPPALYRNKDLGSAASDERVRFRAFMTGFLASLAPPPHVIKMCPPVTFRNWSMHRSLLAVGNASGSIQVINMGTGVIEKEYALHTSPIRGIEWVGLTSFLSYSHPNTVNSLGHVRNELTLTDLQSGRTKGLRTDKNEESPIDMIRVSFLRQYVIIAFKEEPFEIWDMRQLILLRVMPKNFPMVTALDWSPSNYRKIHSSFDLSLDKGKDTNLSTLGSHTDTDGSHKAVPYTKEHLVFTDTNGQLYHFWVEGNVVKHGTVIPADQAMGSVTCIAWKGDNIVLGDVDGNLNIWNVKDKSSKGISTHRGWIKKIRFGPGKGNMKILVLYNDGVDVFDVKDVSFVHQVRCPKEMPRVQDLDWVGSDRPVLATADGCIRVTDIHFTHFSSHIMDYQPTAAPPFSPHVLPAHVSLHLKSLLQHGLSCVDTGDPTQEEEEVRLGEGQLQGMGDEERHFLRTCPFGTAERALHISRLFGDQDGCLFWSVALHFLKYVKYQNLQSLSKEEECLEIPEQFLDEPLDTGFDFFCDSHVYKELQLERAHLHVSKRGGSQSGTQQCVGRLLLLGETDKAVQLLLETPPDNPAFYEDCLRACLLTSVQPCGPSQSIVKLVSTHLIASGRVSEGVQLLCLIRKEGDGCRYLQGAGRWDEAVWLAKATLPVKENQEILKRWIEYLCSPNIDQKSRAILAHLSMWEFWKVVKLLSSSQMTERAALFLQACMEFGVISKTQENSKDIDAIFMDYSRYLLSIKNRTSAIHYCKLVSDIGEDLKKQFQFISLDS